MNVLKMSPQNLILFACDITDAIEAILPDHLFADNEEIYAELESALNISLSHIRNVMPFATNISLCKYITRRRYTIILQRLSFNEFDKMKMHAKYHGIEKFKHKCLQEFPLLKESYSLENMQPPIDQARIQHCLHKNVEKKGIAFITKSLYEDIKDLQNNVYLLFCLTKITFRYLSAYSSVPEYSDIEINQNAYSNTNEMIATLT